MKSINNLLIFIFSPVSNSRFINDNQISITNTFLFVRFYNNLHSIEQSNIVFSINL
jgi:hypothetical protein